MCDGRWYRYSLDSFDNSDDTKVGRLNPGASGNNSDCENETSAMLCGGLV